MSRPSAGSRRRRFQFRAFCWPPCWQFSPRHGRCSDPAAARPGRASASSWTMGVSMSARGAAGPRYQELATASAAAIASALGAGPVELIGVPDGRTEFTDRSGWSHAASSLPPTAADTQSALVSAIEDRLLRTNDPVLVLTDRSLPSLSPRVVAIRPSGQLANVGIVRMSVRRSPRAQLMLRVRNQSPRTQVQVVVQVDGRPAVRQTLAMPPRGSEGDHFIDMPELGQVISAELSAEDDLPADDRAWLVRQSVWPALEPRAALPPPLERMVALYTRQRPPSADSARVVIATDPAAVAPGDRAAIIQAASAQDAAGAAAQVTVHPLTRAVENWPPGGIAADTVPPGWEVVVKRDSRALVTARQSPARQVRTWMNMGRLVNNHGLRRVLDQRVRLGWRRRRKIRGRARGAPFG